jgi:hypothetical protein
MALTYEPIATTTFNGTTNSVTFSSIPSTYTDLRIVLHAGSTNGDNIQIQFNGDTGTNYSRVWVLGNTASAVNGSTNNQSFISVFSLGNNNRNLILVDIFSYTSSNFKPAIVTFANNNNGSGSIMNQSSTWRSTSAITSILVGSQSAGTFTSGSVATLYGIKAA